MDHRSPAGCVPRDCYRTCGVFVYEQKQTGGAGQYAHVIGHIEPMEMDAESGKDTGFESVVMGGNVPSNYIPAVEKAF